EMWINWERWARASGAVFAVLAAAGFVIAGEAPNVSDSSDAVVAYFEDSRSQAIVASLVFATSIVFFLWFAVAVANQLRGAGGCGVARTMLAAGAVYAGVQFVVAALFATLAYSIAGAGDPAVTKALYDLDVGLDILDGLAVGLFVLAMSVGLGRIGSIPAWL